MLASQLPANAVVRRGNPRKQWSREVVPMLAPQLPVDLTNRVYALTQVGQVQQEIMSH